MKTKLRWLFIILTLTTGVRTALAQPALSIIMTNGQALLSWSASATNYILVGSTNLTATNWLYTGDAAPTNYGPQTAAIVASGLQARFFQLSSVPATTPDGMAFIPVGAFTMGDTLDGESDAMPTISVTVSAFYMSTNLVSYSLWQPVYILATNAGYIFDNAGSGKATNDPVQTVNWYDTVKWCNARSQQAGLKPVYYTDTYLTQVYTNGDTDSVYANFSASGYRLPTEAEWEKAARGGLSGLRYPGGDTIAESQADYDSQTFEYSYDLGPNGYNAIGMMGGSPYTTPVGSFAANNYGLYDMGGNVSEWCWDWYGTPYGQPTTTNPTGPPTPLDGNVRVVRGGSWASTAPGVRCAFRGVSTPASSKYVLSQYGFRCVREP